ncbi:hypothetical protein EAF00_008938 [Botryotinia globosa]|nr:hypothetical protein EAF00_008938 [Botryotinia globosa]
MPLWNISMQRIVLLTMIRAIFRTSFVCPAVVAMDDLLAPTHHGMTIAMIVDTNIAQYVVPELVVELYSLCTDNPYSLSR